MQRANCCYANKSVVRGIWYTYCLPRHEAEPLRCFRKGTHMSKTASIGLLPSRSLLSRLMASVDRLLTQSSRIAVRNGDLPYFGL
jgi:hypothetical protein